jgi:peptide/nickel transport system substrate-binding protein
MFMIYWPFIKKNIPLLSLLIGSVVLGACTSQSDTNQAATLTAASAAAVIEPTVPEPTATDAPKRSLVVCMGQEPDTLFLYGGSTRSMWTILEGIYDGPFDMVDYEPQAVILEKMPDLENGLAVSTPVEVQRGDYVIDANGDLIVLDREASVLPSGCTDISCAQTWDGKTQLRMDQLTAKFSLLPNLTWSDGKPLTSADSVYSYQLAADPAFKTSVFVNQRTSSYLALDDRTVEWKGIPGYFPDQYQTYFWTPLPQHQLGAIAPADLLASEQAIKTPLGWGPYKIQEWVKGDHITLEKNPLYFRASEGLPKFDNLVFRFIGDYADQNIAALLSGECDVVDQRSLLIEELETVLTLQKNNELKAYTVPSAEFEHIELGIKPASYDDGYNPFGVDRPDFFGDVRTRQAVTQCINREGIISRWLLDQTKIPVGLYPPGYIYSLVDPEPLPYDAEAAKVLLDQIGWKEYDGDPATPRTAIGIPGIPDGTSFTVKYVTTTDALRVKIVQHVADHLKDCGIALEVETVDPAVLYAAGPEGVLFGRNFDMAQFAWSAGLTNPCVHYQTDQIPQAENQWLTVNLGGFSDENYDAACYTATHTLPTAGEAYTKQQLNVQTQFIEKLPIIPLYYRLKTVVSRTDFCGLTLNSSTRSALYEIEAYDYGETCSAQK